MFYEQHDRAHDLGCPGGATIQGLLSRPADTGLGSALPCGSGHCPTSILGGGRGVPFYHGSPCPLLQSG